MSLLTDMTLFTSYFQPVRIWLNTSSRIYGYYYGSSYFVNLTNIDQSLVYLFLFIRTVRLSLPTLETTPCPKYMFF